VNLVDLLIIVLLVAAIARGLLKGAARQIVPFGAVLLGLVAGAALAPSASRLVSSPSGKAIASLVLFFAVAFIFGSVGELLGGRLAGVLRKWRLGTVDALLGSGVAIVSTLLTVWLLSGVFARVPSNPLSGAIHESKIVRGLDDTLPPIPSVFSRIGRLLNQAGFPDVFAGLEPAPAAPVALPDDPTLRAAVQAAGVSTVRIVGDGCGGILTGSGFVAGPGIVVTNAHVIAGIDRPFVEDRSGRHRATPVFFDSDIDLAVLSTTGLAGDALAVNRALADRGTQGAVLGFPGGGAFRASGAAVLQSFDALGRDIYGRKLVRRNVYQLRADVRPGNSGGPFLRSNGEVVGVVFSASATEEGIGYALTGREVGPRLDRAAGSRQEVDTGPCAA
jgi:S1-C subfamily serine protease